ncbi:PAS domain-containing protein [Nitratidesulfovibrio vulgaris]|uniref:Sensory box protein n=1 Tax=Nitratidesulfovibrio vulgaris (strain ATCC 29579 / DSM 644 / CCUG 34227 / NCIMB 8303 / VKM B-1760 / Hildenborough) TaxID=882 RepID=Q72BT7_NITV2|nr:PAS domain-containing protein [Nitratidesulfovibrio vulgaris]AAS96025.1 sensory box protein [Nitratidesulfovibrio vulgaris str. Hildenborough]ADP86898.1 CI repressor [Nitratidesulfovibrio vulgaris RCH1]
MTLNELVDFYRPRLDASPDLGLLLDGHGNVLHANGPLRSLFDEGYTSAQPEGVARQLLDNMRTSERDTAAPVHETRLRMALPDGAGIRQVDWKTLTIPAAEGRLLLAWGRLRTTEGGREMGFTILPNGNISAVSPMLSAICGYAPDELIGRPARQFYYTDTARRRVVSQLLEKKEVENGEVTLRRKDGSPLILWYSAESIRDASGSMVAYSGYFQQRPFVFSSKLANDFARIVDALPGVAWVCGRDLRIVAVNDSYLEAYNRNRNDVIGRTEHDFLPAEQARYLVEAALRVFEEKQELLHPAVPHLLDPAVWFRTVRRPIFDDARQEVIGLLGIAQDISGKVRQENVFMEQLRATESDVVVVTDDQGRILRRSLQTLSPSIFGKREPFEAYTLDMRPVLDLLDVDDLPKVRQALHAALREHREQHIECRIRNLTGSYTTVLARLVFNDTIYGEPRMYVVARDIGGEMELRQASMVIERLKEAARAKTDRELARFLNVSAASISNARKNDRVPPDWIIDTGLRTGRSIDWLVRGMQQDGGCR